MAISVTQPIELAYERTRTILFRPFDIGKWFVIGFAAWLAHLGEAGFNFNYSRSGRSTGTSSGTPGPSFGTVISEAMAWVHDNLMITFILVFFAVSIAFAFYVLLLWLSSRGKFIFLDNIALNRAAIAKPWKDYVGLSNNFMRFRLGFQLIGFYAILAIAMASFLVMLPDLKAAWPNFDKFEVHTPTILAIILASVGLLISSIVWGFCGMCLNDFVVPLMYLRQKAAWPACKEFVTTMLRGNFWMIVLYGLLKFVLTLGCVFVVFVAGCGTCCIGFCIMAIPYIGSVALLPIYVFMQCYALYFFEQFGPAFRVFVELPTGGFPVIMDAPQPPQ